MNEHSQTQLRQGFTPGITLLRFKHNMLCSEEPDFFSDKAVILLVFS